ncbi:MAG: biopolymer transporter ExbD [Lentisphaerae bacterium]|nr:biopolymer transporter ExbD [Lentisphaerota bacterium]
MPHKKRSNEGCEIDMTPMIDVVFQLIIFFIVTIKMEEQKADIELEMAKHGPIIKDEDPRTMVIEVDKRGWIYMHGTPVNLRQFQAIMKNRYKRHGQFPVLIRGDKATQHKDIRSIMDVCTGIGIWRINFAAIKEKKT